MKNFILLDWDGNIARTLDVWLEACRRLLEKRGMHFSDTEIASCFGRPTESFNEWGISDVDAALDEMDAYAKQHLPTVELYPDALEVLESLKQSGKHLALITTSARAIIMPALDYHNLHDYFEVITCGDDTEHHKPHPEPLQKTLKALGGTEAEAIMIGDGDKDLGAAKKAGIDSILFFPPEHVKFYDIEEFKKLNPTHIVSAFRDILTLV